MLVVTSNAGADLVQTVRGPISASSLGHVASHEHLLTDLRPRDESGRHLESSPSDHTTFPISLETYYEVRRDDLNMHNLVLDSEDDAAAELDAFRRAGGGALVDLTLPCLGRDPQALRRLSESSGVHIVMGCGWYDHEFHGDEPHRLSVDAMTEILVGEITSGADGVRAGVIGEIGLGWPVLECEDAVLRAAVAAQRATGAALVIHPGRHPLAAFDAASRVRDFDGDLSRVVISHIERTMFTVEEIAEVARMGATVSFDLFGHESSHYAHADIDMPNDGGRVAMIRHLVDAGLSNRVVISQDICTKAHTRKWGGEGYTHILEHVLPLMARRGIGTDAIAAMTTENPARLLGIVASN